MGEPLAGNAHLEMPSGIDRDAAVEAADQAAGWLPGFASALYRDARAPVNLTPIAGLERHLHRLQGDTRLALRAVREAVLERNREGETACSGASVPRPDSARRRGEPPPASQPAGTSIEAVQPETAQPPPKRLQHSRPKVAAGVVLVPPGR